jgi:hypothetical protein
VEILEGEVVATGLRADTSTSVVLRHRVQERANIPSPLRLETTGPQHLLQLV